MKYGMMHAGNKMPSIKSLHNGTAPVGGSMAAGFTGSPNPNKVRRRSGMNTGKRDLPGLANPTSLSSITASCCEGAFAHSSKATYKSL